MKRLMATGLAVMLSGMGTGTAMAFDDRFTLGAVAGTTGVGGEISWRFHERLGITASYTDGLDYSGEYETDDVDYDGDLSIAASAIKLNLYPFGGRFYLTAGAMLPDMEAKVTGRAKQGGSVDFNGNTYTTSEVGDLNGTLTVADGVQPYAGLGWRSSHETGLGFFTELGVMSADVEVNLDTDGTLSGNAAFEDDLRAEERRLEDEADTPVYPVAVLGITYTF